MFQLQNFSLIIIPFRSFLCNLTTDDQLSTLRSVRDHLLPGGRLILDIFYPGIEMLNAVAENKVVERDIKSISDPKYSLRNRSFFIDRANLMIGWTTKLYENGKQLWEGEASIALINKREFELLLRSAGFRKWTIYGDFEYNPFDESKKDMVWIIE